MFAHILDHCIFSARWKDHTKRVAFGVVAFLIVANFWWFKGMAWGIEGPINEHWGLLWRKVKCFSLTRSGAVLMVASYDRVGIFTMHDSTGVDGHSTPYRLEGQDGMW